MTNHFTSFSIQPTLVQDLSPQEYKDSGISPLKSYVEYNGIIVSPQGGTASTSVTELVLPGKNGFDLVLKRHYDTATARADAAGLDVNVAITFSLVKLVDGDAVKTALQMNTVNIGDILAGNLSSYLQKFIESQGDYAYSMGQGWRLNLPCIKPGSDAIYVRLPDGSMHSVFEMNLVKAAYLPGLYRELTFEQHEGGADFTLYMKQFHQPYNISVPIGKNESISIVRSQWIGVYYEVRMKDGTVYVMDAVGRVTEMRDSTGKNTIKFFYSTLNRLDYIEDSVGRRVKFEYDATLMWPRISRMEVQNDPYSRYITYEHDKWGVMTSARDAGGRVSTYTYGDQVLFGASVGCTVDFVSLLAGFIGGPFGTALTAIVGPPVTIFGSFSVQWMQPLETMQAPGQGISKLEYEVKTFVYGAASLKWFLFIPIEMTLSINSEQRFFTSKVSVYRAALTETPVKVTDYQYTLDYLMLDQPYVLETTVLESDRKTIYHYAPAKQERHQWVDKCGKTFGEGPITISISFPSIFWRYDMLSLNDTTNVYSLIDGRLLDSSATEYNSKLMPTKQTMIKGTQRREIGFEYDNWGNVTHQTDTGGIYKDSNGSLYAYDDTEVWYQYLNTNSTAISSHGFEADCYTAQDRIVGSNIYDRVIAKGVKTGTPRLSGETPGYRYLATYYAYDAASFNQVSEETIPNGADPIITRYTYDPTLGYLTSTTDANGQRTTLAYDDYGFLASSTAEDVKDADGLTQDIVKKYGYDMMTGWKSWEKDDRGYVTEYSYDALGRSRQIIYPDDDDIVTEDPTSKDWDPSKGTSTRRANNPIRQIDFDDTLLTTTVSDQLGHIVVYVYDKLGNLSFIRKNHSTPSGNQVIETQLKYDGNGNITDIIDPNAGVDSTHAAWYTTKFGYDEQNRINKIIYPDETASETDNPTRMTAYDYSRSGERGYVITITTDSGKGPYTVTQHLDMADRIWREERPYNGATYYIDAEYDGQGKKISEAVYDSSNPDAPIRQTLYYYDSLGRLTDVIYPDETFNENNTLVTATPHVKYGYDGIGNKTSEQRHVNAGTWHITSYGYDGLNRLIQLSVPYTQHNSDGTTQAVTAVTKVYYDGNGNKVKAVDPRGNVFEYGYTAMNLLQCEKDPLGNLTSYAYDAVGNRTSMTDPRGNATETADDYTIWYLYDDLNRLVKGILPDSTPPASPFLDSEDNPVVSLGYDARGNNTSRTEPSGAVITNTFGARNLLKSIKTEFGSTTYVVSYEYDKANNRTSSIDARTKETKYGHDELNRLISVTYPLKNAEGFGYDIFGNKTSYTDGNGNVTKYGYSAFDKLTQVTDAAGGITTYQYDRSGNLTYSKDGEKRESSNQYDELNRLILSTNPMGLNTKYGYDPNGNRSFSIDPKGQITFYTYDVDNRLNGLYVTKDSMVLTTIDYDYDAAGYPKTIEQNRDLGNGVKIEYNFEPINDTTQYVSDPLGRIRNETKTVCTGQSSTSTKVSYKYDVMGNVKAITYPNGRIVTRTLNEIGQLTAIDGFVTLASYDQNQGGLLTSLTLANGTSESFTYDDNSRLETLVHGKGTEELVRFKLTYDNANNVLKRYESQSMDNVYDALNRLKTAYVKGPFLAATTLDDLAGGIVEQDFDGQKALGTGQTITGFSLDMSANSLGIELTKPHLVSRIELAPGTGEHRLRRESIDIFISDDNSIDSYHLVPRDNWTFTKATGGVVILEFKPALNVTYIKVHCRYDDRNETLDFDSTKATFTQPDGAFTGTMVKVYHLATERTENYTYDAVGNRLASTYTYESSPTKKEQTYQYYTKSDRLKTDGKYAFKYDANGNLIEKGTVFTIVGDVVTFTATYGEGVEYWQYGYDALNRLIKVTKSGLAADDGTVVEYVYDPTGLRLTKTKGISSTLYAFDLQGNQIYDNAGGQEHCYVWAFGKTLARVDGDKDSPVKYFFHTDMQGSTVIVTDKDGNSVWTGDVTPFGEKVEGEGNVEGAARFTGKEYDEDTGLYYFNARWYDPEAGRFFEEDTYLGDLSDPVTLNRYAYAGGNPLRYIDPTGNTFAEWMNWLYGFTKGSLFNDQIAKRAEQNAKSRDRLAIGVIGDKTLISAQASLTYLGYNLGSSGPGENGVDGVNGTLTQTAIKDFQAAAGLPTTGELDAYTLMALDQAVKAGVTKDQINQAGKTYNNLRNTRGHLTLVNVNYNAQDDRGGAPLLDTAVVPDFLQAVDDLRTNYGITLQFTDMFRDSDKQSHFQEISRNKDHGELAHHSIFWVSMSVSPHEIGRGFDVAGMSNYTSERCQAIIRVFESYGFKWQGPTDPCHFTAVNGLDKSVQNHDLFQSDWTNYWEDEWGAYDCNFSK